VAAGAAACLLLPAAAGAIDGQPAGSPESAVRQAVARAVKARMGQDADVRIEDLAFTTTPAPEGAVLAAIPEPGARLARQNRFSLQWVVSADGGGRRTRPAGHLSAKVFVAIGHVRTTRGITRGEVCADTDVGASSGEVGAVLLQRLPDLSDVVGAKGLRPMAADDVVTRQAVQVRPSVVSGDVVAVQASVDGVTVQGEAVAQQSGREGDIIRVMNRESRRPLKARVVGPRKVEVIQ
jgi:flagella basal body P-ring formation protein FlgA